MIITTELNNVVAKYFVFLITRHLAFFWAVLMLCNHQIHVTIFILPLKSLFSLLLDAHIPGAGPGTAAGPVAPAEPVAGPMAAAGHRAVPVPSQGAELLLEPHHGGSACCKAYGSGRAAGGAHRRGPSQGPIILSCSLPLLTLLPQNTSLGGIFEYLFNLK